MIKADSMHTLPKGKIPPKTMVTVGCMCHGISGMTRAIWLVLVGTSILDARNPKKDPTKTKGIGMHSIVL